MRQMKIVDATPMTKQELADIRAAWSSFTTLGTARWWDLGLRLLATIADQESQLTEAREKLDHWENGVQDEDCPYLADVKEARGELEAMRRLARRRRKPRRLLGDARELIDRLAENAEELTPVARRVRRALDRILHP